mgnify:CR=1 FL=1|tara:strand:- start:734 stop:928 length:195 start_codon:yes stop_codon:yes gene_type:complete
MITQYNITVEQYNELRDKELIDKKRVERLEKRIKFAKDKLFSKGKTLYEVISENLIDKQMRGNI